MRDAGAVRELFARLRSSPSRREPVTAALTTRATL
jgi:hypothetical protein